MSPDDDIFMQVRPKQGNGSMGLQQEQSEKNSLKVGIDKPLKTCKQSRLLDGGKHAPGREFQRDVVRGIKLSERLL